EHRDENTLIEGIHYLMGPGQADQPCEPAVIGQPAPDDDERLQSGYDPAVGVGNVETASQIGFRDAIGFEVIWGIADVAHLESRPAPARHGLVVAELARADGACVVHIDSGTDLVPAVEKIGKRRIESAEAELEIPLRCRHGQNALACE